MQDVVQDTTSPHAQPKPVDIQDPFEEADARAIVRELVQREAKFFNDQIPRDEKGRLLPGRSLPTRHLERVRTTREITKLARSYGNLAVHTLAEIMLNPGNGAAARTAAASVVLERGFGKAPLDTTSLVEGGGSSGPSGSPNDVLREVASLFGAAAAALNAAAGDRQGGAGELVAAAVAGEGDGPVLIDVTPLPGAAGEASVHAAGGENGVSGGPDLPATLGSVLRASNGQEAAMAFGQHSGDLTGIGWFDPATVERAAVHAIMAPPEPAAGRAADAVAPERAPLVGAVQTISMAEARERFPDPAGVPDAVDEALRELFGGP